MINRIKLFFKLVEKYGTALILLKEIITTHRKGNEFSTKNIKLPYELIKLMDFIPKIHELRKLIILEVAKTNGQNFEILKLYKSITDLAINAQNSLILGSGALQNALEISGNHLKFEELKNSVIGFIYKLTKL